MKEVITHECALCSLILAFLVPSFVMAGDLEPTASHSEAASAMHTTDDIYNRLQTGATGTKRTGGFTEPSAGPTDGVGKSLDAIMNIAPAANNVTGAAPSDVANGKSFWGLRTDGGWGVQSGTATSGGSPSPSIYPAPVPKSGQTTSHSATDDGATQKGVPSPNPRFTTNNNGTVTDNLTGLIWLANAHCPAINYKNWWSTLTAVAGLKAGECGLTDGSVAGEWRVPTINELYSLVSYEYYPIALPNTTGTGQWKEGDPFSHVGGPYMTSTSSSAFPAHTMCVSFSSGFVNCYLKIYSQVVWPVRDSR